MDKEVLSGIIEIRDPEIDAEASIRRIRENIRQRRAEAGAEGVDYEAFVGGLYTLQAAACFEHSLYYDLRRMSVGYDNIGVGLSLTESGLPLIGPLVQRVRAALRHLVIYYVNMLAGQQVRDVLWIGDLSRPTKRQQRGLTYRQDRFVYRRRAGEHHVDLGRVWPDTGEACRAPDTGHVFRLASR